MIATKPIPLFAQTDKQKFWDKVDKISCPNGCWLWTGKLFTSGYGRHVVIRKNFRAHRIAFVLSGRDFRNGSLVLHGCRKRHCVNPAHLYSGTQKRNCADMERDGTVRRGDKNPIRQHPELVKGESNGNARLTESIVRQMRLMRSGDQASYVQLGRRFGVSAVHAAYICKRKNWKHVE